MAFGPLEIIIIGVGVLVLIILLVVGTLFLFARGRQQQPQQSVVIPYSHSPQPMQGQPIPTQGRETIRRNSYAAARHEAIRRNSNGYVMSKELIGTWLEPKVAILADLLT